MHAKLCLSLRYVYYLHGRVSKFCIGFGSGLSFFFFLNGNFGKRKHTKLSFGFVFLIRRSNCFPILYFEAMFGKREED